MKKHLLLIFAMLLPMVVKADAVEIDGIYYNLISKAKLAEVTKRANYYSGDIVIPESVTYEGENYNVTSIGHGAFAYCTSLTSITIPNSMTSIGDFVFFGCKSLTSVSIPNSVISIGYDAFYGCI